MSHYDDYAYEQKQQAHNSLLQSADSLDTISEHMKTISTTLLSISQLLYSCVHPVQAVIRIGKSRIRASEIVCWYHSKAHTAQTDMPYECTVIETRGGSKFLTDLTLEQMDELWSMVVQDKDIRNASETVEHAVRAGVVVCPRK